MIRSKIYDTSVAMKFLVQRSSPQRLEFDNSQALPRHDAARFCDMLNGCGQTPAGAARGGRKPTPAQPKRR